MNIDIICPLYNAKHYIKDLHHNILKQKNITINSINYIVTETNDGIQKILDSLENLRYDVINKEEFSHSLTRELYARKCDGDILVFITQDIIIEDEKWLYNLTRPIIDNECEASYSRQLCSFNNMEKYTREKNYPEKSLIKTKDSISELGLNTFFYSDASSAIRKDIFLLLNGYDGKKLPTNEDMYIAYKLIMAGYRIKYCSDSVVIHSHDFTLKETYERYKTYGQFFKQEPYINQFGTNKKGAGMASYILKRAIQDKNLKVLIKFIPNMIARFIGMKVGQRI